MWAKPFAIAVLVLPLVMQWLPALAVEAKYFPVPAGDHPHDVAPAPDGTVWYTGQRTGVLGRLDPKTGGVERIPLGKGSAPHGVIVGPDGAAWVTDGGQNAIVRVDPVSKEEKIWPLPASRPGANLNTAAFDGKGRIWFTGQTGIYGRLDPATGKMEVWDAPKGVGPYGITATPSGDIYYVSLAGSFLGKPDLETGETTVIEPKMKDAGTRRVWSIPRDAFGLASGTSEISASTIRRRKAGPSTSFPAMARMLTLSMWMTRAKCGLLISAPTPFSASIPRAKRSRASQATSPMPQCVSSMGVRARSGVLNPARIVWW